MRGLVANDFVVYFGEKFFLYYKIFTSFSHFSRGHHAWVPFSFSSRITSGRDLCSGGRDWWRPVWLCWRWIWIRVRMLLLQYNCCGWRPHIHNVLWEHNNSYQRRKHCLMIWWILTNRTRIPILCCGTAAYKRDASKSSNNIFGNLRTRVKTALDIDQFALFNCEAMIIMCRYLHNVPVTLLTRFSKSSTNTGLVWALPCLSISISVRANVEIHWENKYPKANSAYFYTSTATFPSVCVDNNVWNMVWRRGEQEGDQWGEDIKCLMISECDCSQSGPRPPSVECSAVKRSIGFTIGFHNHGEGPY